MKKSLIYFVLFGICISMYAKPYKMSIQGKQRIKKYESFSSTSYWDSNGYSIGYGHHGNDVKAGMKITRSQAEIYFLKDVESINSSINRLIGELPVAHNFSQSFIDGLGDLIYNCGENGIRKSDFFTRLKKCRKNNKQDLHFAIAAVKTCRISAKGHVQRRYDTHKLMLN